MFDSQTGHHPIKIMYKLFRRTIDTNGYVLVKMPYHPRAIASGSYEGYVYEHIVVAENLMGRSLLEGEVVHHLDQNRQNNSPDNLLILSNPMHAKLHGWMNKYSFEPNKEFSERIKLGCIRCIVCEYPIYPEFKYCSANCSKIGARIVKDRPSKETLEKLVWSKPTTHISKDYGVSDKTIEKWCKIYSIEKPPRGYWVKPIIIE